MTSDVKIIGWRAEGLRCPDYEINCCHEDGTPYAVSLIQMPNGTGKTTTLTLLRSALSGALPDDESDPSAIRSFQKRDSTQSHGSFTVRLLLNGRLVTIIMDFDFQQGTVQFKTTRGSGQVDRFDPPVEFKRFLCPEFAKFFVFDGELAAHLLDRKQVHAEDVVEVLFQINALRAFSREIKDYWDSRTDQNGATEDRTLSRRVNRVHALRERLESLEDSQRKQLELKRRLESELADQRKQYEKEINKEQDRKQKLSEAQGSLAEAGERVEESALEILEQMRDPHALSVFFAHELQELKDGLDRVKLPEGAAREFFEELAQEEVCVCGRPIDDHVSSVIRDRAYQYLGSDDIALLNSLKTAIHEAVGASTEDACIKLSEEIVQLGTLTRARQSAHANLEQLLLEVQLADPKVKDAVEAINDLERRLHSVKEVLEQYDNRNDIKGKRDDEIGGIPVIRKRLEDAEEKAGEIADTLILKNKRDILTGIIDSAHRNARKLITEELCRDANRRIADIVPSNRIAIARIDGCLVLDGQEGASQGETLSVAYAFLSTLFHRSDHSIPFIVDSPAGPIDLGARPKIGELVPRLTDQFIAFTISSERSGFVPRLKKAARDDALFLTLFRKGAIPIDGVTRDDPTYSETSDGVMISGESFFNGFQLDREE